MNRMRSASAIARSACTPASASTPVASVQVAGGVDQAEPLATPHRFELDPVARDPGQVVRDRLTPAEQAVRQRRLADVLTTDDRDAWHDAAGRAAHDTNSGAQSRPRQRGGQERLRRIEVGGVDHDGAVGGTCGVVRASRRSRRGAPARRSGRRLARRWSLGRSAPLLAHRIGLEVQLDGSVGEHHRADVSTLHHRTVRAHRSERWVDRIRVRTSGWRATAETFASTSRVIRAIARGQPSTSSFGRVGVHRG